MVPSEPRYKSVEDLAPDLSSVKPRAATCGKLGPGARLSLCLRPNLLLKPASNSVKPFLPPKVEAPATSVTSPSFLAPAISCSSVCASSGYADKVTAKHAPKTEMTLNIVSLPLL